MLLAVVFTTGVFTGCVNNKSQDSNKEDTSSIKTMSEANT